MEKAENIKSDYDSKTEISNTEVSIEEKMALKSDYDSKTEISDTEVSIEEKMALYGKLNIEVSSEEKKALSKILSKSPYKSLSELIFDAFGKTTGSFAQKNLIDNSKLMYLNSIGLDPSFVPIHRYVTIRVAMSDPRKKELITERLIDFLKYFDIEVEVCLQQHEGSWFANFMARTTKEKLQQEFSDDLKKAKLALEISGISKPQSETDRNKLEAAAKLIESIKELDKVCIQLGSVLVTKNESDLFIRDLTINELQRMEENAVNFRQPDKIIEFMLNLEEEIAGDDRKRFGT